MSYSFSVCAADKSAALIAVNDKLAEVVQSQKCHLRDQDHVLTVAGCFISLLADDPTKDVSVSLSGHLTGVWVGSDVTRIEGAAVNVTACLVSRLP